MAGIGSTVGKNRADAIYRFLFFLFLIFGGAVLLGILWAIGLIAGVIWMLVDVAMQGATNSAGWTSRSMGAAEWLQRLFYWPVDILEWLFYGTGRFPWLP